MKLTYKDVHKSHLTGPKKHFKLQLIEFNMNLNYNTLHIVRKNIYIYIYICKVYYLCNKVK